MNDFKRFLLRCLFRLMKVRVSFRVGEENLPPKGIYISNHVSWLDPLILYAFLPKNPIFLLHPKLYRNKGLRFFMSGARTIEYNYMDAAEAKKIIERLNTNDYCVMFPEGCMTDTGDLMKIYEAPAVIADRTGAPLIPVWINGAEYSPFSETEGRQPHRWFPKVKVKVGEPKYIQMNDDLKKNRDYLRDITFDLLNKMRFEAIYKSNLSLFKQVLRSSRIYGKTGLFKRRFIVEDINRKPQTYRDLLLKSYVLGYRFTTITEESENVGVILPNTVATVVSFLGLSAYKRVPVMLNFSQGPSTVLSMCQTAQVKRILTSKAFVLKAKLGDLIDFLEKNKVQITYLEDLAKTVTLKDKLRGLLYYKIKKVPVPQEGKDPAVILFTSGSEGAPKAVVLSHSNLLANIAQTTCYVKLSTQDIMFNCLPMFHSFGLNVATFWPLVSGAKLFLFPSPLLYRTITELLYELKVTVMVATESFFKAYATVSHPYDFKTVRCCFGGAEAVKEETRRLFAERLGCQLMEGYGTTECSPVVCVNTTLFNKFGTIGRLAVGMDYKVEPVPGIAKGGEFCVSGPNVMKGYIYPDNPGVVVPVKDGWYHTGDVVVVDDLGFVKIVDRVKRFAKIAGEMISLASVENVGYKICHTDDFHCGVVAIPHAKKGEQIIFVSDNKSLTREQFVQKVHELGLSELHVPSQVVYKEQLPLFATGKADNVTLKKWVLENVTG